MVYLVKEDERGLLLRLLSCKKMTWSYFSLGVSEKCQRL